MSKQFTMVLLIVLLASFSVLGTLNPKPVHAADEYDGLRLKLRHLLLGDQLYTLPVTDTALQDKLTKMDASVSSCSASSAPCSSGKGYWDLMNRGTDRTYLWVDLPFTSTDSYTKSGDLSSSYGRLYSLAVTYSTPGTSFYQNSALKADLIRALDWLYAQKYNTTVATYGNWYHWQIGIPQALTKITVLLYDDLSATQLANYMGAVERFIPSSSSQTVSGSPAMTGANLLDQAIGVAYRGIIVKDSAKLADAVSALRAVFPYVSPSASYNTSARDGFYEDGSFIQHAAMPYIGGYGAALMNDIGILLYLFDGSSWSVTDANKWNVYRWVFDSVEPFMYSGNVMDMVRGRNIAFGPSLGRVSAQPVLTGKALIGSLCYLLLTSPGSNDNLGAAYPSNPSSAIRSMLKGWLSEDTYGQILADATVYQYVQMKSIVNDPTVSAPGDKTESRVFASQDRAVHTRPGFAYGISMSSARVDKYESGNKNNIQGWYTGDGMTYLYNDDTFQYDNFWPTVNRYRLPGTTVDTQTRTSSSNWTNYMSPNTWAGGSVLNGRYSAIGMDLKAPGDIGASAAIVTPSNLTAKKSWFLFDNEIVALGAGITNSGQSGNGWDGTARKVESIVDNRKLNGSNVLTVNGTAQSTDSGWSSNLSGVQWMHLAGNTSGSGSSVGYYFPGGSSIHALRESRTGTWNDINGATSTTYTVYDTADTFVRANDSSHGSDSTLMVKNDASGYVRETYLQFDLAGTVPNTAVFDSAKIVLTPTAIGPTSNTIQHTAEWVTDNSWTESGLLWDNKPASTALSPVQQWSGMTAGTSVSMDVTSALTAARAAGQKSFSIRIYASSAADSNGWVQYASREHANAGYRPKLVFGGYKEKVSADYMTLWLDHGTNPANASYSYVTLPNMSPSEVASYSNSPDVEILENSSSLQAVREKTLNVIGANFWQDTSKTLMLNGSSYLTANKKASVVIQETSGGLDLAVSDPTQANTGTIELELAKTYGYLVSADSGITVTQTSPTIKLSVQAGGTYGKSLHVRFSNTAPVSISSSDDSFVRDGTYAGTNYGSTALMEVKNEAASYNRNAYVQFDLSSYTGSVSRAYILLTPGGTPASNVTHQAKLATGTWSESALTWNNKPSAALRLAAWKVPSAGSHVWIDVTDQVKTALSGSSKKLSIEVSSLTSGSATFVNYMTKENSSSSGRPILQITP